MRDKSIAPLFLVVCVLAGCSQEDPPTERTMLVKVIGPDGKPMSGVKIHRGVWTNQKPFKANSDVVTNGEGQATVSLPATFYILRLWASKDGFVPLFSHWEKEELSDGEDIVPEEFTLQLQKGTIIGGFVINEEGKPIKGAKIEVQLLHISENRRTLFRRWLAYGDDARLTDAQGFWRLDNVPSGRGVQVHVKLSHPDYTNDQEWGGLQSEQNVRMESLRDSSSSIVMHSASP